MANTIPKQRAAHFTGCVVPFLTIQGHDNGPSAFGHPFTYTGITISPFFEILDQGSRWLINLLVIVILSKDETIMGELLTLSSSLIYRWSQDVFWEVFQFAYR